MSAPDIFPGPGVPPSSTARPLPDTSLPEDRPTTDLDRLRSELAPITAEPTIDLEVPLRDGWSVRYGTRITAEEFDRWTRQGSDRKGRPIDGVPPGLRSAAITCARKCEVILHDGEEEADASGPLRLNSQNLLVALGATDVVDAVRLFYGRDADVLTAAGRLYEEAGWTQDLTGAREVGAADDLEDADPTPA